jgi:hypothetical protein
MARRRMYLQYEYPYNILNADGYIESMGITYIIQLPRVCPAIDELIVIESSLMLKH